MTYDNITTISVPTGSKLLPNYNVPVFPPNTKIELSEVPSTKKYEELARKVHRLDLFYLFWNEYWYEYWNLYWYYKYCSIYNYI